MREARYAGSLMFLKAIRGNTFTSVKYPDTFNHVNSTPERHAWDISGWERGMEVLEMRTNLLYV